MVNPEREIFPGIFTSPMAIPKTKIKEAMIKFLECEKSISAVTTVRTPTEAIIPKRIIETPPITGVGMVCKTAPNFPITPNKIAYTAAILKIAGS